MSLTYEGLREDCEDWQGKTTVMYNVSPNFLLLMDRNDGWIVV
jgi:hypothetical protein